MPKKEEPFDHAAFIKAQSDIQRGIATVETCGYTPRNYHEGHILRIFQRNAKRAAKQRADEAAGRPVKNFHPHRPKPTLTTLRDLVKMAAVYPGVGIPIGRSGWPPSNATVHRAVRKGYATLKREFGGNRLIATDKGLDYAARD